MHKNTDDCRSGQKNHAYLESLIGLSNRGEARVSTPLCNHLIQAVNIPASSGELECFKEFPDTIQPTLRRNRSLYKTKPAISKPLC